MAKPRWSCAPEKKWRPCWARTRPHGRDPAGTLGVRDSGVGGFGATRVPVSVRKSATRRKIGTDWIHLHSHRRSHQVMGVKTPAEEYALAV